jgi:hypothetical protein
MEDFLKNLKKMNRTLMLNLNNNPIIDDFVFILERQIF